MIITIDGPAGSGKSTAARKLAGRLEIAYLDTGAMYRAIAYVALRRKANFSHEDSLIQVAREVNLELDCGPTHTRVRAEGHDVTEAIRSLEVSAATSQVAKVLAIRALLVEKQREIGRQYRSFVSEGRDQGSVVFPHADAKFVLDATLEKRAQRRFQELTADGEDASMAEVMVNLASRDHVDAKQWEPLLEPGKASIIDTTEMTISQVIDQITRHLPL